jgi:hypothetical protein
MLQTRIDRNVEVVTCLLNLTERGSLDWNTGISSQPYRREVMQHFSHLKKHPAVLLTNQLHAQGFWWDAMIELAVTCTVFPEAALTADLRNSRYVNAGEGNPAKGKKTLDELLDLIDDFYIQAEFDDFYRAHQPLYDGIIREVEAGLPDAAWLQLVTDYYGAGSDEDIQGFYLIPSPLSIGGNGFGPEVHRDGELEVYNVFAPFRSVDAEEASCGFDRPEQLAKLAMHEFGHSFVNHALESPRHKGPITRFAALYAAERATKTGSVSPSTSSVPARSASPWSQGNRKARRAYCSTISNSTRFIICRRSSRPSTTTSRIARATLPCLHSCPH